MEKLKDALREILLAEGVEKHLILSTQFDRFVEENQEAICHKILEYWDQHSSEIKEGFDQKSTFNFSSN
jgi:hypothetical protein